MMEFLIPFFMAILITICMGALFLISRVSELPLPHVHFESQQGSPKGLAVILSGASGWVKFDQRLAEIFSAARFEVMGLDSLRYFFQKKKTPALLAEDLSRVIQEWLDSHPGQHDIIFVGYSKGADVLPFAVNLLKEELRSKVKMVALLGVARLAAFRLGLGDLLKGGRSGPYPHQVTPEIRKLENIPGMCIYGDQDRVSLCRNLKRVPSMEVREVKGGPTFHDADQVAEMILSKFQENQEPSRSEMQEAKISEKIFQEDKRPLDLI
ncbi:MAG: AcvB/VirJ family lysyl-phosphatidylglycerol hydrolase [Pseudobdellovibrionaceae bacterium]